MVYPICGWVRTFCLEVFSICGHKILKKLLNNLKVQTPCLLLHLFSEIEINKEGQFIPYNIDPMQSAQLSPIIKNNLWKFGSFECQLYFILIKKLESSTLNFSCINVFIICTVCCNIFCIALAKRSLTRDWSALLKKISCGRTSDFF